MPMPRSASAAAMVGVAATMLFWGMNYVVLKFGVFTVPPITFVLVRFVVVAVLLGRWLAPLPRPRQLAELAFLALVGVALYQTLFSAAVRYTTSAAAALLLTLSPAFVAAIAGLLGTEPIGRRNVAGIVVALVGALVAMVGTPTARSAPDPLLGDLLALGAALTWAVYTYRMKHILAELGTLPVTAWTALLGAAFVAPLGAGWLLGHAALLLASGPLWALGYTVGPVTLFGLVMWQRGVQVLGAARTSAFLYALPVVSALGGILVWHEPFTVYELAGFPLLLAGVRLATLPAEPSGDLGGRAVPPT
jgi:drug/metabolite transporter (DMT)-like permease